MTKTELKRVVETLTVPWPLAMMEMIGDVVGPRSPGPGLGMGNVDEVQKQDVKTWRAGTKVLGHHLFPDGSSGLYVVEGTEVRCFQSLPDGDMKFCSKQLRLRSRE